MTSKKRRAQEEIYSKVASKELSVEDALRELRAAEPNTGFLGGPSLLAPPSMASSNGALKTAHHPSTPVAPEGRASLEKRIERSLTRKIAATLGTSEASIDPLRNFMETGLESKQLVAFTKSLGDGAGVELLPTLFFECQNIRELAAYLAHHHAAAFDDQVAGGFAPTIEPRAVAERAPRPASPAERVAPVHSGSSDEPVAIIGVAGVFPQSRNLEELWAHLERGADLITEAPEDRPYMRVVSDNPFWGGYVPDVDAFDASFFGISKREAELMDPKQRIILELVWKAIEDSGQRPSALRSSSTGLFLGIGALEYGHFVYTDFESAEPYAVTGVSTTILPNRISYLMGWHGPSEAIDTACSSSLVAIHRAIEGIRNGDCDQAVAGGVNLILSPFLTVALGKAGMLSEDGRCKSFDRAANGYVRAEGAGALVLKRLSTAVADGDHVYAIIRGSAVNHGGPSNSLTAPNPKAQEQLVIRAYERAGVDPRTVSYVEAHGTGTKLGDPVEVTGLVNAFCALLAKEGHEGAIVPWCGLGSVKTNVGHLEAASGVAGIIKVLLAMKHERLPRTVHFKQLNDFIKLEGSPFHIQREATDWKRIGDAPRRASISSFGFGGVNAHLVLEESAHDRGDDEADLTGPFVFALSAKKPAALKRQASQLAAWLERELPSDLAPRARVRLRDVAYTLHVGRDEMIHRLAIVASSVADLRRRLTSFVDGETGDEAIFASEAKGLPQSTLEVLRGNEGRDFVRALLAAGRHEHVASLWTTGVDVDWLALYANGRPRRVSLPTYPFARDRYWKAPRIGAGGPQLHRLLDRAIPALPGESLRFTKTLAVNDVLVRDHRVSGKGVLPGVCYLEMALQAFRAASGDARPFRLARVIFERPLIVDVARELTIEIAREGQRTTFAITSANQDGPILHAAGDYEVVDAPDVETLDIVAAHARCDAEVDPDALYAEYGRAGLRYGPFFRCLKRFATGDAEAVGWLELAASDTASTTDFTLNPALMDSALHVVLAHLYERRGGRGKALLPFSIDAVESLAPLGTRAAVYVRTHDDGRIDVAIVNPDGVVAVKIHGLGAREAKGIGAGLLRAIYFEPIEAVGAAPRAPRGRAIVVYADDASDLEQALFARVAGLHESIESIRLADARHGALETALRAGPAAIVYVVFGTSAARTSLAELRQSDSSEVNALFDLAKVLDEQRAFESRVELVVFTCGAIKTSAVDTTIVPSVGGVAPFLKSLHYEYPDARMVSIDLDPQRAAESLAAPGLVDFLADIAAPSDVAIRDGRILLQKSAPIELADGNACGFRDGNVYLIAGGAGGIGLELAEHLATRFRAKVALVGRRALDDAKAARLRAMSAGGGEVVYVEGDVTDLESMQAAVATVKDRFGAINGVLHLAFVLVDALLAKMTRDELNRSLRPKVRGSIVLAEVLGDEPLDFLAFFSSGIGIVGSGGQCNYAAGNGFQDAFAAHLSTLRPYPVQSINWGYWGSVGAVASPEYAKRLTKIGLESIMPDEGFKALEQALALPLVRVVTVKGNAAVRAQLGDDGRATIGIERDAEPSTLGAIGRRVEAHLSANADDAHGAAAEAIRAHVEARLASNADRKVLVVDFAGDDLAASERVIASLRPHADRVRYVLCAPTRGAIGDAFVEHRVAATDKPIAIRSADAVLVDDASDLVKTRRLQAILRKGGVLVLRDRDERDQARHRKLAESGLLGVRAFRVRSLAIRIGESDGVAIREKATRSLAPSVVPRLDRPAPVAAAPRARVDSVRRALDYVKSIFAESLKEDVASFTDDSTFAEHGVDSLISLEIRRRFERELGKLPATLLFDHATVRALASYFDVNKAAELAGVHDRDVPVHATPARVERSTFAPRVEPLTARLESPVAPLSAPVAAVAAPVAPVPTSVAMTAPTRAVEAPGGDLEIAIVGLSGRYPESPTLDALVDNLRRGRRCVRELPRDRWASDPTVPARYGAFLDDVDKFDPLFFQISPAEAEEMDPQERIMMELALHALEDAGYPRGELLRRQLRAGVFLGQMSSDYLCVGAQASTLGSPNLAASYFWSTPNRISYWFNLRGPSLAVGTACSSSLTAVHLAARSIASGECEIALAGGVNLILHPDHLRRLGQAKMLTSGNRTRSFGRNGDGFVAGEGAGIVVLKPLAKALADGDHVYAILKGSAVAGSGKTNGYLAPSLAAQRDVVAEALANAKVAPATLSYVESAATGSPLNDAIEVSALTQAFRANGAGVGSCAIGTIKSNMGHLESASGIAALTKVLLQLRAGEIFPSIDADPINPEIDFASSPFRLQTAGGAWPSGASPRRAGVSSFGAGGAVAHVIVEELRTARPRGKSAIEGGEVLVVLSARDGERLREYARSLAAHLDRNAGTIGDADLPSLAFTLQTSRDALDERAAFVVASIAELRGTLSRFALGAVEGRTRVGRVERGAAMPVAPPNRDLLALADRWVRSGDVDWRALYGERPTRMPLPGYPFARKRCWIRESTTRTATTEPAPPVDLRAELAAMLAHVLHLDARDIGPSDDLSQFGLDSIRITTFVSAIAERFAIDVTPTLFFGHDTIAAIAATLSAKLRAVGEATSAPVSLATNERDPIAIIGMSGRFPQSEDLDAFWSNLVSGKDMVGRVPADRWNADPLAKDDPALAWGGFAPDVDRFDAEHFGLSAHEARLMDPQQRLFLETVWRAFEDAGYTPFEYAGRKVGVFAGVAGQDYLALMRDRRPLAHMATGNAHSMLVNRVSYMFDFTGPSEPVDTACSASLVAVHRAIASLDRGECEIAVAGGVNVLLGPDFHLAFADAGMLSKTGRCRTFDAEADGYVRAEGVGAVLLKPLRKALAAGDHVYGIVKGSAVNHGGHTASLTAPNPQAQRDVLIAAYDAADVDVDTVGFIEAHGTGTRLGDPIEIEALKDAFSELSRRRGRSASKGRCGIGAVKSNIGHLETAAGVAGLVKVLLAMREKTLPGNLHFKQLNPYIRTDGSPFFIVGETMPWDAPIGADGKPGPRRAGVSSFGFGGVNAHVVVEEFVPQTPHIEPARAAAYLIPLSAATPELLRAYAKRIHARLTRDRNGAGATRAREVIEIAARVLGVDAGAVEASEELLHLGLDAVALARLVAEVNDHFGTSLAVASFAGSDRLDAVIDRVRAAAESAVPVDAGMLARVAFTLQTGRLALKERAAVVVTSMADLVARMDDVARGAPSSSVYSGSALESTHRRLRAKGGAPVVGSLDEVARRWAAGEHVDFAAAWVTSARPARIALPAVPFASKRYWFDEVPFEARPETNALRESADDLVAHSGLSTDALLQTSIDADAIARIKASLASVLGATAAAIPDRTELKEMGLDSIMTIKLVKLLNKAFRTDWDPREVIANPTVEKLAILAQRARETPPAERTGT